jgi:hypothetical protein
MTGQSEETATVEPWKIGDGRTENTFLLGVS